MLAMCHSDLQARLELGTSDHASGDDTAVVGGDAMKRNGNHVLTISQLHLKSQFYGFQITSRPGKHVHHQQVCVEALLVPCKMVTATVLLVFW